MTPSQYEIIQQGNLLSKELFPIDPHREAFALKEVIKNSIEKREPFSLVRFGDGEGRILAYPKYLNDNVLKNEVLSYQFGRKAIPNLKKYYGKQWLNESVLTLATFLKQSMISADVIGAPSHLHYRKPISLKNINPRLANSVVLKTVSSFSDKMLFDVFIFKAFHKQGLFPQILNGLDFLGIISHTDNTEQLEKTFHIKKCVHIRVPGHQTFMKSDKLHFPNEYKKIIEQISIPYPGAVFLVAAGYLGKLYCHEIKSRGGIALDIGSVFDSWIGLGRIDAVRDKSMRL